MAKINPGVMQVDSTNFIDANEVMLGATQAQIAKTRARLAQLEKEQEAANIAKGLNPDGSKKNNTQILKEKKAKEEADRAALEASNPLFNKALKPNDAPAGKYYAWIGGTDTGQWKLYNIPGYKASDSSDATPKVLKPGDPGYVAPDEVPERPVGTPPAYVYDPVSKTYKMPTKPTGAGTWVFDANNGWVDTTIVPGSGGLSSTGTKTLALDTFKNTLALLFGAKEAGQPWVTALYTSASKFYNTGSTIDESINLSLQDIRFNKELKPFTDRFKGIYALTDRLAGGEAIEVPTVAEYFKSESSMGDILRAAGMGELATQDFLGDIIGRGKSVLEVTNLITDTFDRIDNAPSALKADLLLAFPGADRASIAKAMLTGVAGAAELTKKVKAISVQSAAKTQGITINDLTSQDIAAQGYDYNKSLQGFATVAQTAQRGATLGRMSGIDLTQQEAIASAFGSNAAADEKLRKIREEEANRFSATSGRLASQNRVAGLI